MAAIAQDFIFVFEYRLPMQIYLFWDKYDEYRCGL